jgi:hypothetical protein
MMDDCRDGGSRSGIELVEIFSRGRASNPGRRRPLYIDNADRGVTQASINHWEVIRVVPNLRQAM